MSFKRKLVLSALLLVAVNSAFAVSIADLTVSGTHIPVSCAPIFSGVSVVDCGKMVLKDLSDNCFAGKSIALSIACDSPMLINYQWEDEKFYSVVATFSYGFGLGFAPAGISAAIA
ncbi:DUF1120 domain-containing protein [Pseudomonas sp. SJZ080]|uniref:DUF1120 domain-containing protein n=1 Tax=Pseudomonas sp. SJZ080 TaxID=2572888 RepID=UPI00119E306E|nr:DUF1120 domain-containing protein [Pseudomonas sp. SJZ080]